MRLIDIAGNTFGRLLVLRKSDRVSKSGGSLWICHCECGAEVERNASNLRNGSTISCGCAGREWAKKLGANPEFIKKRAAAIEKHGHKRRSGTSQEYNIWLGMKSRCDNPKNKDYKNYGARGIRVCERWKDFRNFFADMGNRPPGLTIDRLRHHLNYGPGNCRWATVEDQASENRRGLIEVEILGVRYANLARACRAHSILPSTVNLRIKSGMSIIDAVLTPVGKIPNTRTRESYLRKSAR